jgi:aldehyde:ferredoxin oxidoreductase
MECFERGLLTRDETGGLELRFGNADAMISAVHQIARRDGVGDLLAEGCLRAAQRIGRGTEEYAIQVKGQEVPMHEPRVKFALNLGYATSPTGADHMHNIHDTDYVMEHGAIRDMRSLGLLEPIPVDSLSAEKVRLAKYHIEWRVLFNCLGLCMFMPYSRSQVRDLVQGTTGWNSSILELVKVGERALAMARVFNYREGLVPADDEAPRRFSTPFQSGPGEGVHIPAAEMKRALELYYQMNAWSKRTGAPVAGKLHELGLHWLAETVSRMA